MRCRNGYGAARQAFDRYAEMESLRKNAAVALKPAVVIGAIWRSIVVDPMVN